MNAQRTLNSEELWNLFRSRNPRFPYLFAVYHYFRR